MKLWWTLAVVGLALPMMLSVSVAESELWEELDDKDTVLVRTVRGAKASGGGAGGGSSPECRYSKGQWSECDPKNNVRTRTLSLKKGDNSCEQTKTITKKCKKGKACRYTKGTWSNCDNQIMARIDNIKANSDSSCDRTRRITKKCKPENNTKKAQKDRSNKKNKQQ